MKQIITLVLAGIILIALLVASIFIVDITTVEGNEIGVKETWDGGVISEPLQPKTYVRFPGFTQKVFKYDISSPGFVMNEPPDAPLG